MTLLVVVVADEQILVGADGKATFVDPSPDPDQHTQFTAVAADKFKQVGDRPLMWGQAGLDEPAGNFAEWIDQTPGDWSWDTLKIEASAKVVSLNEPIRTQHAQMAKHLKQFGLDLPPFKDWFWVLLVGYVGGVPNAISIDENGVLSPQVTPPPGLLGAWTGTARVAWQGASRYAPGLDKGNLDAFRTYLDAIIEAINGLHPPPKAWRITPTGCEVIEM